ncbi:MAG: hypothetical protein JWP04_2613, partial [Belnapia sp.]|nr:hypothetical protein [Belnapia sp.]
RRSALRQALGVRGAMVLVGTTSVAHLDEALGHAAGAEVPA